MLYLPFKGSDEKKNTDLLYERNSRILLNENRTVNMLPN